MMRAVLADVGPLYATADLADEHHRRATFELKKLDRDKTLVIVSYPTLLEAHTLVLFRLGRTSARAWLGLMSAATLVNPEAEDYRQAIATLGTLPDQKITLYDALLAALAARMGLQVWTYDHHFDLMRVPVWR